MPRETPSWWYGQSAIWPVLLAPVAFAWDVATRLRWALARPYRAHIPVICIGNLVAGGAGKTPAAIRVARLLIEAGERPVFLTRGYGGTARGPHFVERGSDSAREVGDEALLLVRVAPTIVAADRAAGARLAEKESASVIIMDDGFQNPGLNKDFSFVVVDRATGAGNGKIMPSGPLRAGLNFQMDRAHAVILAGDGSAADGIIEMAQARGLAILHGDISPRGDTAWLERKRLVAFAGIGHPEKFFHTLEALGCTLVRRLPFADHYAYTPQDAEELLSLAQRENALLVTTEKDMARLEGVGGLERLRKTARVLPVRLDLKDTGKTKRLLKSALKRS